MSRDTKVIKIRRLERANKLEAAFAKSLRGLGLWCHHIRSHNGHAPLLDVPLNTECVRAPDLIVFDDLRHVLIEVKESLIREQHITLYTHQIRDYQRHLSDLPFILVICASAGEYSGYIGAITLHKICELVRLEDAGERILIPVMALDLIGSYEDTDIILYRPYIERMISAVDPHIVA